MPHRIDESRYNSGLASALLYREAGKISKSLGLVYEAHLPGAAVGSLCKIFMTPDSGMEGGVDGEVIGFRDKKVILMPFEQMPGVNNDSLVLLEQRISSVRVGPELLGRVIDGRGRPIDGKGEIFEQGRAEQTRSLYSKPSHPLLREMIHEPLNLGIRSIDGLLTSGKGQRVGIMAGSGVGKSVLLGMMARNTAADVNVIALVGERGREVREFIERDLGPEGLARSVVVLATSDSSPLVRMRAAFLAMTVAEHFRDQGKDVLFLMDSITRFCMAQREIGLSLGEPPASKGYTPSVFSTLPKLLERAGTSPGRGSITALMTVLVEGDDMDEPIADAVRSIIDGHIVLTRSLAERNHYPAVDILRSTSRVMPFVTEPAHRDAAARIREWIATYNQVEDLVNIGAYARGSNPRIDLAIAMNDRITSFLRQGMEERSSYAETAAQMIAIVRAAEAYSSSVQGQRAAAPPAERTGIRV